MKASPFILVGALAFVITLLPPYYPSETLLLGVSAASTLLVGILIVHLRAWREVELPTVLLLLLLVPIALLREAEGGASSGYAPLALLPVLWLCLTGTRKQMYAAFLGATAILLLPIVLIGGEHYPASEWRRWVILLSVGAVMAEAVLGLRQRLTSKVSELKDKSVELQRVTDVLLSVQLATKSLADGHDARQTTCAAARSLTGADVAIFFEVGETIEITAWDGGRPGSTDVSMNRSECAALQAHRSGSRVVVDDFTNASETDASLADLTGATFMIFQPVIRRGRPIGVLSALWRSPMQGSETILAALELLADEAAIAIEHKDLVETLDIKVHTDELTGLPNRRSLEEALELQLSLGSREDRRVVVAFIDLDHFKSFNDRNGHQAGDLFLKEASAAWRQALRDEDMLFRYGGEEFVAILPRCSKADAVVVMDRLRAATPIGETSSVGLAAWSGTESATELLRHADRALYVAKAAGRDRTALA